MRKTRILILTVAAMMSSVAFADDSSSSSSNNNILNQAMSQAKGQKGDSNSSVTNPFVFCSGPKPAKGDPMRLVFEQICNQSQKNGQSLLPSTKISNPGVGQ